MTQLRQQKDKELVKKRFERSLSTYEQEALVQISMGRNLIECLTGLCGDEFDNILEIGSGCGNLTRLVVKNLDYKIFTALDIIEKSEGICKALDSNIKFIAGDMEEVKFPVGLDLVISNATLQWCDDFEGMISKAAKTLNPKGIFAFTTFGPENFREFSSISGCKLDYSDFNKIKSLLTQHFKILYESESLVDLEFDSPRSVLHHIRLTGVNSLERQKWTKAKLKEFENTYTKRFSDGKSVTLTYHPFIFICSNL